MERKGSSVDVTKPKATPGPGRLSKSEVKERPKNLSASYLQSSTASTI